MPHAAWYLGPFMCLFQTDLRGGVAVLNRLLNHAALIRARTLARPRGMSNNLGDVDIGQYLADLEITGTRQLYVGDEHVWRWYRGTGVGPVPCMSALQALEYMCDQLIEADIPIKNLVPLLLEGCENLAMVGLVVGILVRHLEAADDLLDSYFIEPLIWHLEFRRVTDEHSGRTADSEGIEASERRKWSLREAAMVMALNAEDGTRRGSTGTRRNSSRKGKSRTRARVRYRCNRRRNQRRGHQTAVGNGQSLGELPRPQQFPGSRDFRRPAYPGHAPRRSRSRT